MRIYIRPFKDMPKCKHCGKRMDYWVPGLPEDEHAHPECAGRAMSREFIRVHITYDENGKKVIQSS